VIVSHQTLARPAERTSALQAEYGIIRLWACGGATAAIKVHIEWRDGPHASEVATLLAERVRQPGIAGSLAGLAGPATASTASLDVMGVSFVLRAIDPLGMTGLRTRPGLWRMSATLDNAVGAAPRGTSRHLAAALGRAARRLIGVRKRSRRTHEVKSNERRAAGSR
jgi:hypothetical protein